MSIADLLATLQHEVESRVYFSRLEVFDQSPTLLKARLYISTELFVQIYRNNRFDTTNLVLIHNGRRVYARDQLGGTWHRHTTIAPELHDTSIEGRQSSTVPDFLNEVETVLTELGLP
jgi:hypothetical protein